MKLSVETKVELQHAMIRAGEMMCHHTQQADIARNFLANASHLTEKTMAKFYRLAKYHDSRAKYYQAMGESIREVLFGYEQ